MIETLKRIHVSTFQQNKAHMIEKLKNIHVSCFHISSQVRQSRHDAIPMHYIILSCALLSHVANNLRINEMDQICHKPQFQRLSTLHSILHSPARLFVCLFTLVYASGVKTTRVVTGIFYMNHSMLLQARSWGGGWKSVGVQCACTYADLAVPMAECWLNRSHGSHGQSPRSTTAGRKEEQILIF